MRGNPQFSFRISIALVMICFSRIFSEPRKNTFELVGTVLKRSHLSSQDRNVALRRVLDIRVNKM